MKKRTEVEVIKENSDYLRGTLKESLENQITGALYDQDKNLIKFHGMYEQDDRDRREIREEKKLEPDYSFMIRLRIPAGKVSAKQWLGISQITQENGTGVVKITTRQTVQLHGVIKSKLRPTLKFFDKYNLDSIAACGDVNRNVMASNNIFTTQNHEKIFEYAAKISEHLLPKTRAYHEIWLGEEKLTPQEEEPLYGKTYLPRKFKIAIAIPPNNDVDVFANDIGLIAIIENGEFLGFNIAIGGGLGATHGNEATYPRLGSVIGFVSKEKTLDAVWQIVAIQRDFGNREDRKLSRLKYTVDKYGIEWFRNELENRLGYGIESEKSYEFTHRGDYYGWERDYKGNYHYTAFVECGRVLDGDAKLLTALNEIAALDKSNFIFTGNQNIIVADVAEKDKASIDVVLEKYGVTKHTNSASSLRKNSIACVAFNTCPLALAEGQRYLPELVTKVDELLEKHKILDRGITIRMTGCPNGCGRPYLAEIGMIGTAYGKYNLHLGGDRAGIRLNKLYKNSVDEGEILTILDSLFEKYKKEERCQSFGDFVNKIL